MDRKFQRVANEETTCHPIFDNLYLGSAAALSEATHLTWTESISKTGRVKDTSTTNERNFVTVITVCPVSKIARFTNKYSREDNQLETSIKDDFSQHNIAWHQVGKNIEDDAKHWIPLVASCSPDLQTVDASNVEQWFEPIFKILDQALFHGAKTLVHCEVGQSRSATLLTAYLINRFDVSAQEALNFLCRQRPTVKSQFLLPLQQYEQSLAAARAEGDN